MRGIVGRMLTVYRWPWRYPGHASCSSTVAIGPPGGLRWLGAADLDQARAGALSTLPDDLLSALSAAGPRPCFALMPPDDPDGDRAERCASAVLLAHAGDRPAAREALRKMQRFDNRSIDIHLALFEVERLWSRTRARSEIARAVALGELSVRPGFGGMLPWSAPENRAFLRALRALAWTKWSAGDLASGRWVLDSLLWLDPADELGAAWWMELLDAGVDAASSEFPALSP